MNRITGHCHVIQQSNISQILPVYQVDLLPLIKEHVAQIFLR